MLKVALTGGMACGKSVVGEIFTRLGAHVVQADVIAHELLRPGEAVYDEIVARFGRGILKEDGTIDRPKLAQAAFTASEGGETRIQELNAIVHPAVIRRQEEWMEDVIRRDSTAVAMVEAALIFEAGVAERFDKIVVVACDPPKKLERFAKRANLTLDAAEIELTRRSAAQIPDAEKARRANFVINNSGTLADTELQTEQVYQILKAESERRAKR